MCAIIEDGSKNGYLSISTEEELDKMTAYRNIYIDNNTNNNPRSQKPFFAKPS